MESSFLSIVGSIVTVALIVCAARWLYGAKGAQTPRTRDGASEYGIKWQWRAVGLAGCVFWIVVSLWSWHDLHSRPDGVLIAITMVFVTVGVWLASGSVTTNETGIAKTVLWHSRSFRWEDISEVRLHKKQGGAIELLSGARKLVIDSRINAFEHLLNDVVEHAHLQRSSETLYVRR